MSAANPTHNYSHTASEGALYAFTKDMDIAEIAKLVRKQIKATWPQIKTSVTIERFAGGCSLNVEIKAVPFKVNTDLFDEYRAADSWSSFRTWAEEAKGVRGYAIDMFTPEAKGLEEDIKALINQYNYDDSDSQTDYFNTNFYSSVDYAHELTK